MSEIEEVKLYIQQLEAENKRLKDSNSSLRTNNKGLLQGITKMQKQVNELKKNSLTEKQIEIVMNALAGYLTLTTAQFADKVERILRGEIK